MFMFTVTAILVFMKDIGVQLLVDLWKTDSLQLNIVLSV